ncbi:MAG: hypothetical protein RMK52_02425 [Chitinophagales bacterium]|nr:hypothetical protein [Chitinophagales bacterium]MDW8393080.1 hypothetical protein [Chitinophagales bacterium]
MNELAEFRAVAEKIIILIDEIKSRSMLTAWEKELLQLYCKELTTKAAALSSGSLSPTRESQAPPVGKASEEKQEEPAIPTSSPVKENGNLHSDNRSLTDRYGPANNSLNDLLRRQAPDVADRLRLTPIRDLKAYIGLNRRFAFVGLLFNDDEARYEQALDRLNACTSLDEAMDYLKREISGPLKWDMNSEVVSEFTTLIQRRYL